MSKQGIRTRARARRARYARTVTVISMVAALLGTWYGSGPTPAAASHGFCEPVIYAFDPFCFDPFPYDYPYGDPFYDPFCCFEPYIPPFPPDYVPPTLVPNPPPPVIPNDTHFPRDVGEQQASGAHTGPVLPGSPEYGRLVHDTNPSIEFWFDENRDSNPANDDNEDSLMTAGTRERLDRLATLVMNEWPGTRLFVTDAYDADGGHGEPTLHAEGRAVDLQTSPQDTEKLARLAQLAVDAGFTWVNNEYADRHVHASAPQDPPPPEPFYPPLPPLPYLFEPFFPYPVIPPY